MMKRREQAVTYKHQGCNCCQAVLLSFAEELGLPQDRLMQTGAGFGVGMGGMEATCGALCGAQMVLGLKQYDGKPMLKQARDLYNSFEKMAGATICKELKGIDTGKVVCPCDDCVRYAVDALEGML